jgi:hypothetical protein|tara:strand:+ start:11579 stop:11869 length:291 start_codon:yes stop_codon:yes gene_type:complete
VGFEVRNIDLSDMARANKEGVRFDVSNVADKKDNPLAGVTSAQRNRNRHIGDVLNIGAGTRCTHCGFLHFLWRETCGACDKPMEYNLGHRDETKRA